MQDSRGGSYYMTSDETEQAVIEACYMYKEGRIKLVKSEEIAEESKVKLVESKEEVVKVGEEGGNVYAEVTKCVDAIAILRSLGVEGSLTSKAKILEAATARGVEFPNL
jgi:hypothetical protein